MSYDNAVANIHTFMIPIAGAFFVILGIILIVLVEKKKDKFTQQIPLIYLALIIIQMVSGYFFYFTSEGWLFGIQLHITGLIGIHTYFNFEKHWMIINTGACLYNLFAIAGIVPFLGYSVDLFTRLDTNTSKALCITFYNASYNSGYCNGYLAFARIIAFFLFYILAFQTFLSYLIYKDLHTVKQEAQKPNFAKKLFSKTDGSYESIANPGDESE